MKKQFIPALALSAMLLVSPSAFAAQLDTTDFLCFNPNAACAVKGACVNQGQCVNASNRGCSRLRTVAASAAKSTPSDTTELMCPRANNACIQNGACINDGNCRQSGHCLGNGISKRDGTGVHHSGQERGHHKGNRGR